MTKRDPYSCCDFYVDENDPEENTPETAWHYLKTCLHCGYQWKGLHCIHDGYQNPCGNCGIRPTPIPVRETDYIPEETQ